MPRKLFSMVALTAFLLVAAPAGAAGFTWSAAKRVAGGEIRGVSCPSASQCTALTASGRVVTVNPATGKVLARGSVDPGKYTVDLACAGVRQCTVVDGTYGVVTFDPTEPGTPRRTELEGGRSEVSDIACASARQCTIVSTMGEVATFNPRSPDGTQVVALEDHLHNFWEVECPTLSRCVAAGIHWATDAEGAFSGTDGSFLVTFDPSAPDGARRTSIDGPDHQVTHLSCPSARQCAAMDMGRFDGGNLVTFDPGAAGAPKITPFRGAEGVIDCPTTTRCVMIHVEAGKVSSSLTFDPARPDKTAQSRLPAKVYPELLDCPSATLCVAADGQGNLVFGRMPKRRP